MAFLIHSSSHPYDLMLNKILSTCYQGYVNLCEIIVNKNFPIPKTG